MERREPRYTGSSSLSYRVLRACRFFLVLLPSLTSSAVQASPLWDSFPTPSNDAWQKGQWSNAGTLELAPVHAALTKSGTLGKIIVWAKDGQDGVDEDYQVLPVNPPEPPEPITFDHPGGESYHHFCAGHASFFDPRDSKEKLLIVGGPYWTPGPIDPKCPPDPPSTRRHPNRSIASIYDPATNTFEILTMPVGDHARWYPTCLTLPSGKVLVLGGTYWVDSNGDCDYADAGEINYNLKRLLFDPAGLPSNPWTLSLPWTNLYNYPHMFVMERRLSPGTPTWEDGLFYAGPNFNPPEVSNSVLYNWAFGAQHSSPRIISNRSDRSAVLFTDICSPQQNINVLLIGGETNDPPNPAVVHNTVERFRLDEEGIGPEWTMYTSPPYTMRWGRKNPSAVLLPDGNVFIIGGTQAGGSSVLECETYKTSDRTILLADTLHVERVYHSVALLLPDGRVFAAGSNTGATIHKNYEIYYPPYLFAESGGTSVQATRPVLSTAPTTISYGNQFSIGTPDPNAITEVVLMRPGSETHSWDMSQRRVVLDRQVVGSVLYATAPPDGDAAPPGYYMLFIINGSMVPSVAKFVYLGN